MTETTETIDFTPVTPSEVEFDLFHPDVGLVILTWITFFLLLGILYKFAWRRILIVLDDREKLIRRSLEDADRIKEELAGIHETRHQMMAEAEARAGKIIEQARQAAEETSKIIQGRTREEVRILTENARREIAQDTDQARAILREETARIAVELAGRLIEVNLDDEKNRRLVDELIKKM